MTPLGPRAQAAEERRLAGALARLDRRGFLKLTGAAAAAGLLPLGCGGAPAELAPPPDLPLRVLSPRSFAALEAAAQRLLGPVARERVRADGIAVAARADARLASLPALAGPLQQALLVLEFGIPPLVPKLRPFTRLDPAARDAVLRDLSTARFGLSRALFQGVRSVTWLSYYGSAASHAGIAYPGPFGDAQASVVDAMTYDVRLPNRGGRS